jgi:alpha-beta hydrolase superfamily lysophospholipase
MTALPEKTGKFEGSDGVKIFYRHYPAEPERARLVIAHGLGEHSGRYGNVIDRLRPRGVSIWAPDHRGHGQSEGRRGHVLNFIQYLTDLRLMIALAREDMPADRKCFLLGHSLGGLIALYYAQRFPELIDGVLASSPALGMAVEVPAVKKILGACMSSILPGFTMGNELDATKISHDPDVVSAYESDPLVHDRVSARFFTEFMAAMETVHQQAPSLQVPLLMQVAGDDHLVSARSAVRFFETLAVADKTLHVYDGLYHEIYNELKERREQVLTDLENWLEKQIIQTR